MRSHILDRLVSWSQSSMTLSNNSSARPFLSWDDALARVPVPLPFSPECIVKTVSFRSGGSHGVSLEEWIRLLEELVIDSQILYQCRWPGYDAHTCYIPMPEHVVEGLAVFKKSELLDMVCQTLARWILAITRCKQIECREPNWAIGLGWITFKHIYVVSVVEVQGYLPKWAFGLSRTFDDLY
ncbi:hypothetical protein BD414DRAFT_498650 [Trametes punicea]|nr:hypothetical protein BD414DRAFT_504004 [Trametes punicea]KAI8974274.1 hypothetical protein BD414DRAFT_498650 [Trametes punicea]